jgi:hypothetical protein
MGQYVMIIKTINKNIIYWPMQIFTPEEMNPSEKVIKLIKQIAYTYRVNNKEAYCLN